MLPLYDMLAAQNGQAFEALSRHFGLSQQQAQAAVEAVLPAFSQGLKRNASDPYGLGTFLAALSSGQHANYFDNPANAFSPAGLADGNGVLGHLFGSKDLSRAVAQQASSLTGLGEAVIRQMLPAMAAIIMGGMFKQMTGQLGPGPAVQPNFGSASFGGSNPLADAMAQMMRQGTAAMTGQPPQRTPELPNPMDNPFGRMMQDMFAGASGRPQEPEPAAKSPSAANPFGKMMEDWMRLAQPGGAAEEPQEERRENPSGRPRTPWDDLFGDMFETGARQRDDYQKNMEAIVDRYLRDVARNR